MVVNADMQRMCWICHLTDGERGDLDWISPCKWLNDESGCREDRSSCPNGCGVRYVISEPVASMIVRAGTFVNHAVDRCTPVVAVMGTLAGAWAGLACYGAATIAVVCGRPGIDFLKRMDKPRLFAWLPMIPLGLFALRLKGAVELQIQVQQLEQHEQNAQGRGREQDEQREQRAHPADQRVMREPGYNPHRDAVGVGLRFDSGASIEGDESEEWTMDEDSEYDLSDDDEAFFHVENPSGPQSLSRLAVGGLLAPYMSYAMGLLCFGHIRDIPQLDRSVYGGILYIFFKSIIQKFFRCQKRAHVDQRRVLDYVALR